MKQILDGDEHAARATDGIGNRVTPIVITRWNSHAQIAGSKGARDPRAVADGRILVSATAKSPIDDGTLDQRSIHWFLETKFTDGSIVVLSRGCRDEWNCAVGLERDWACVVWDSDFRHSENGWQHFSLSDRNRIRLHKAERQMYLKNALSRAVGRDKAWLSSYRAVSR